MNELLVVAVSTANMAEPRVALAALPGAGALSGLPWREAMMLGAPVIGTAMIRFKRRRRR